MKKEEKTRRTYEKIMSAAIVEFGSNSYDNASLTTICNQNRISKGLLYHNFRSKDELYLRCVQACFCELTDYLRRNFSPNGSVRDSMQSLLRERQQFFLENPYYSNIFFNTVLQPPMHLRKEIREIRGEFDRFSAQCCRALLDKLQLREGITKDMASEYFLIFQEMFNGYFQSRSYEKNDFHALIRDHEVNLSKILDIMLYGIAEKTAE